jgi:hypothetical protein
VKLLIDYFLRLWEIRFSLCVLAVCIQDLNAVSIIDKQLIKSYCGIAELYLTDLWFVRQVIMLLLAYSY